MFWDIDFDINADWFFEKVENTPFVLNNYVSALVLILTSNTRKAVESMRTSIVFFIFDFVFCDVVFGD